MRCSSIISAYFCKDWLHSRITNLLDQTEVPRIVAVCQGNSEESKILAQFPEVLAIHTVDVPTVYEAWNMALDAVTTPFINIANSDCRLENTALQEMCDELEKDTSYGLAYSNCHVVYELNGDVIQELDWAEGDLLNGCFIGPSPVYRTELHKLYGKYPTEYIVAGDYYMWLKLQHNGVKFLHIKKPLVRFWNRSHDPSIENNLEYKKKNLTIFETAKIREYWKNASH